MHATAAARLEKARSKKSLAVRSSLAVASAFNLDENRAERRCFPAERFPTDGSKILESENAPLRGSREASLKTKTFFRNSSRVYILLSLSNNSFFFYFHYLWSHQPLAWVASESLQQIFTINTFVINCKV